MAIKLETLTVAILEAERFLLVAKKFGTHGNYFDPGKTGNPWLEGGVLAANTKRASMDLSRALAMLRKGDD